MLYDSSNDNKTQRDGIWVLEYAWDLYTGQKITARDLMLLSYTDRFTNCMEYRRGMREWDQTYFAKFMTERLKKWLRCDRSTFHRMLKKLSDPEGLDLIRWHIPKRGLIRIQTRPRLGESTSLCLDDNIRFPFHCGKIGGSAMVLLGLINERFWRQGNQCFAGNDWLCDELGVKHRQIINLINELKLTDSTGF